MSGILVGVGTSLLGGIFGSSSARRRRKAAEAKARQAARAIARVEANRQAVINPYEGTKSLAELATDLSGEFTNPYANLGVATQAAEANTLDTLRATGASAGGATALAQAALKSKQGVAASIEQQEAKNEQLKAQGEAQLQAQRVAEQQRLQGIQISEGQRVQAADAAGKQFKFNAQEARTNQKLNRLAGQQAQAQQQAAQAAADQSAAWAGAFSGITSTITAGIGGITPATSTTPGYNPFQNLGKF
jgi:hypothetical protein